MTVDIEGVVLHLAHPDELSVRWVGQEELMRQLLAAWLVVNEQDLPMNPRLLGKPGVGKTTLAYAAAKRMERSVYILQATMDTRPEDLLITPVIEGEGRLRYVASPLVSAMITGGVAILDEGNRMSEKSWASLTPPTSATRRGMESTSGASPSSSPVSPPTHRTSGRRSKPPCSRLWARKPCAIPMAEDAGSLDRGRFRYFPVAPGRMEFAMEVRRAILHDRPDVVAVELPVALQPMYHHAISRLPEMSVLFYPGGEEEDHAVYVIVEPADPF